MASRKKSQGPAVGDTEAPVGALVPWERNPRRNDEAARAVAREIRANGWGAPVVVQAGTGRIIAGHTRLKAARLLRMERVPVRVVDIDDRRARRMALADNRLGELAEWDEDALAKELGDFSLDELETMGWSATDLERMLDDGEDALEGMDEAVDIEEVTGVADEFWISIRGPLPAQADALERVRRILDELPDEIDVELRTVPYG